MHERARSPAEFGEWDGQFDVGETIEQAAERDLRFHSCQRRAEAEVDAVAEGQMLRFP